MTRELPLMHPLSQPLCDLLLMTCNDHIGKSIRLLRIFASVSVTFVREKVTAERLSDA